MAEFSASSSASDNPRVCIHLIFMLSSAENFPHSPILHYVFSSWIEKKQQKQYIAIGKTDLFNSSMGLCGILPSKALTEGNLRRT